ncbi:LANO_0F13454g1_1 [Lachancea nothofagi CBS 11611]|uniref:LANO_0F13454g1_1 n=1 Tax=Lachancea nothofagi CBS 11611 TaxID=1266666 RepID=A0A1G4KBQ8_9SACH|nr:LANO_0F13454g1_1 [Lachancea nothofagi CBS 11611]
MFSIKQTLGFLLCLRPIGPKRGYIHKSLSFRRYNSSNNNQTNNTSRCWSLKSLREDFIEDRPQPISCIASSPDVLIEATEGTTKYPRLCSDNIGKALHVSFLSSTDSRVEALGLQNKDMRYDLTLDVIVQTLSVLEQCQRYYEIHNSYLAYRHDLSSLRKGCSPEDYAQFVKIVLKAEFSLRNFVLSEALFSEYIKFPNIEAGIIDIGLVTLVKNRNFALVKEFYVQVLKNPETFPISPLTLHAFAFEVFKTSDLIFMKQIMHSWLDATSDMIQPPLNETFSLLHRLLLKFEDSEGLSSFFSHSKVQMASYEGSEEYDLCIFRHDMATYKFTSVNEIADRMNHLFLKIKEARRIDFYTEVLNFGVSTNDFSLVKFAITRAQQDDTVELTNDFHKHVCHYFVKQGSLTTLVHYLRDVVRVAPNCHLGHVYVEQLWCCALENYPILSREITNDIRLILNREDYLREYNWLSYIISKKFNKRSGKVSGSRSTAEKYLTLSSHFSSDSTRAIHECITKGDMITSRAIMLNELQHGIRPSFAVLYSLLKLFIRDCVDSARLVDQIMRETYRNIPLKTDILWLKHNTLEVARSINRNSLSVAAKIEAAQVAATKIKDFEKERRAHLNFQNYMQLSSIFLILQNAKLAAQLLERGRKRMDSSNRRDWYIYYSNALKIYTRARDPVKFLSLLKEWNSNTDAWLVTNDTLRSCKGFVKYFEKHPPRTDQIIPERDIISEINMEIDTLLARYVNFKFQGLNDMRMVTEFLQNWIDQDLRSKLHISEQATLQETLKKRHAHFPSMDQ